MFPLFSSKKTRSFFCQIVPKAVPTIFPLAAHGYCLEKNLKSTYKNPTLTTLLWQMAASKTPQDFRESLKKFQDISPRAAEWLIGEADPEY